VLVPVAAVIVVQGVFYKRNVSNVD